MREAEFQNLRLGGQSRHSRSARGPGEGGRGAGLATHFTNNDTKRASRAALEKGAPGGGSCDPLGLASKISVWIFSDVGSLGVQILDWWIASEFAESAQAFLAGFLYQYRSQRLTSTQ